MFIFLVTIIISSYIKANILWNLTDYFIALLAIINVSVILKIDTSERQGWLSKDFWSWYDEARNK